jgi:predicted dehydrogenase
MSLSQLRDEEYKLHIALIGYGVWGRNILQALLRLQATVTVYDPVETARAGALAAGARASLTGLPGSRDGLDGIVIATPSTTHFTLIDKLAALALPIFVEKPLVASLDEALRLLALAPTDVFVMHVWRYHPGVQMLADIARTEELGPVTALLTNRTNWTSPRRDTDSLWNLAPHDLSIARTILGYIPPPRSVAIERHANQIRGMVAICGHTPFFRFEVSNRYADKRREIRLHALSGVAVLADERSDHISIYHGNDRSDPAHLRREDRPFGGPAPLQAELAEFLHYLTGGPPPRCSLDDGIAVVRVLDELQKMSIHE